jgi:hypothetical protein
MEDIDVWRSAHHMMKRYGDDAGARAAKRADELQAEGATEGANVWRRIMAAIAELEREPSACEPRN